ncbi:MAG: M23 family metallopeptidase [Lachnospiraceae bacterium]|nr:M23 family metallopeptidase [Lachnospiraceae bacterium]
MDKKFVVTMCICFCAVAALGSSSFYVKTDSIRNGGAKVVHEQEATKAEIPGHIIVNSANNSVKKEETTLSEGDRVAQNEQQASSFTGNMVNVSGGVTNKKEKTDKDMKIKDSDNNDRNNDKNRETTTGKDGYIEYLSEVANNVIKKLEFDDGSTLMWPVEGNVLLEYNMDNTVFFKTLNEYKTNDSLIIQSKQFAPVKASAKGVVTQIDKDDKTGVYVKMSIGNGYEIKYSQIINPVVEVGDVVEAGQTIACVNEPTRFFEKEGYNLTVKVTKDGKPVDPMDYLIINE